MVSGNEPWFVNSKADTKSLSIAKGGTATSPPFCVTALSPSLRFFARSEGKSARLDVDVIYTNPQTGANDYLTAGTVGATTNWAPTPQMLLWANLLSAISPSGTTNLALRFTAVSGTWFVDDVYVDPFRKG